MKSSFSKRTSRLIISANKKKMEAENSSLKKELHEVQGKLDNSRLREQSEICTLSTQLAVCNAELALEAGEKERIKAKMEAFKGKLFSGHCRVGITMAKVNREVLKHRQQFRRKPRRSV